MNSTEAASPSTHAPHFHPATPSNSPHPLPAPAPASLPDAPQGRTRVRPPASRPNFPRFTSLPFPPRLQLRRRHWPADLSPSTNERRPLAPVLLGRTKQKQSEREQRRSEAAAEAEERGLGRRTGVLEQRRPRPEGSVAAGAGSHAREDCARLPRPGLSGEAAARWEGEGAWRPRPGRRGRGPGASFEAPQAPARRSQRPGLRPAGPGSVLQGPAWGAAARARPLADPLFPCLSSPPRLVGCAGRAPRTSPGGS